MVFYACSKNRNPFTCSKYQKQKVPSYSEFISLSNGCIRLKNRVILTFSKNSFPKVTYATLVFVAIAVLFPLRIRFFIRNILIKKINLVLYNRSEILIQYSKLLANDQVKIWLRNYEIWGVGAGGNNQFGEKNLIALTSRTLCLKM